MVDPVLNRPMFQGSNLPLSSAKGTGITSMVTPPDTAIQQLKAFANPVSPTVQGFAGGGSVSPFYASLESFLRQHPRPSGGGDGRVASPVQSTEAPSYASLESFLRQHPRPSGGGDGTVNPTPNTNPENSNIGFAHFAGGGFFSSKGTLNPMASESRDSAGNHADPAVDVAARKYVDAGGLFGYIDPKDVLSGESARNHSGPAVDMAGGRYGGPMFGYVDPRVPLLREDRGGKGYADGGPVQHFQEGGVASMWDNFVKSLTIKEPNRSGNYRLPDVGLRIGQQSDYRKDAGITGGGANYVEPIDIGGPDAVMSEEQRNAVYMRNAAAQQAEDPRVAANLENDAAVRERQQATRDAGIPSAARIQEAVGSGASRAMLPRVLSREGPDLLEQQQREMGREANRGAGFRNIGQEPPPPMPGPGFEVDTSKPKGAISTHLSDIKAERASQSAADRRENALLALMSAGFGMAAGKSRHALQNIAEGGQQGIGTFAQLEKGRREDENRRYLSALHEKEVALRERDLEARLPLIAAQTEAQRALPEQRRQMNEIRAGVAQSHAQQMADKAFKDIMSNPMSAEFKAISSDKTGTVAPSIKKRLEEKYFNDKYRELMLQKNDGLGIRSVTQPSE